MQCALQNGIRHSMAWIPKKFAVLNKYIKIKRHDDTWEDGWQVVGGVDGLTKTANDVPQTNRRTFMSIH